MMGIQATTMDAALVVGQKQITHALEPLKLEEITVRSAAMGKIKASWIAMMATTQMAMAARQYAKLRLGIIVQEAVQPKLIPVM